jgi:hypothetical protein
LIQNAAVDSGSQVFRCSLFCIGTILIIHRYLCVKGEAADHADGITLSGPHHPLDRSAEAWWGPTPDGVTDHGDACKGDDLLCEPLGDSPRSGHPTGGPETCRWQDVSQKLTAGLVRCCPHTGLHIGRGRGRPWRRKLIRAKLLEALFARRQVAEVTFKGKRFARQVY